MELIQLIGGYAGAVVTIIGLLVMVIKPIRQHFTQWVLKTTNQQDTSEQLAKNTEQLNKILESMDKLTQQNKMQSEALTSVIRNTIMHLYYQYIKLGEISAYERENIEKLFKAYKSLGGNSFVEACVEELRRLPVKM